MIALAALAAFSLVIPSVLNAPKLIAQRKEKKQEKKLENILSMQGTADNAKKDVNNAYLTNSEFTKYFGPGNTSQGYAKQGSGKTNAKTYVNLESENCPILDYMMDCGLIYIEYLMNL